MDIKEKAAKGKHGGTQTAQEQKMLGGGKSGRNLVANAANRQD